jgi:hypothetical protein
MVHEMNQNFNQESVLQESNKMWVSLGSGYTNLDNPCLAATTFGASMVPFSPVAYFGGANS